MCTSSDDVASGAGVRRRVCVTALALAGALALACGDPLVTPAWPGPTLLAWQGSLHLDGLSENERQEPLELSVLWTGDLDVATRARFVRTEALFPAGYRMEIYAAPEDPEVLTPLVPGEAVVGVGRIVLHRAVTESRSWERWSSGIWGSADRVVVVYTPERLQAPHWPRPLEAGMHLLRLLPCDAREAGGPWWEEVSPRSVDIFTDPARALPVLDWACEASAAPW